ncbi:Ig-like domain-containing protein [Candidatus Nitrosocosmicus hydrocola]|uniref:Ig-like domain-containing protein n=1 Tax=Candidatus Nitrosocosmicus hydrocola TaxID=1826872 RepID=UPI0011E5B655|nr:Ig-like domain-containing protein [Candidatus Nitrosocosmicus hydrocola]
MSRLFTTFLLLILVLSMPLSIGPITMMNVQATTESNEEFPPEITVPDDPVVAEATGPQGAEVRFVVTATNSTGAPVVVKCLPSSDTEFALGTTTVECTAVDSNGNEAVESFEVLVHDTTPPTSEIGVVKTDWMGLIINNDFTISDDIGFQFTGSDLVGIKGFECSIDNGNWRPSTIQYGSVDNAGCYFMNLDSGLHTVQIRAIDTSNNIEINPQSFSWTIIPLENSISNLRDFVSTINLPNNLQFEIVDSLNSALGNVQDDGSYDNLLCEYLDEFAYGFAVATLVDSFNQDVTNFVDNSYTAIRDRTGCNPPTISLESEITVDEGVNGVVLDASRSFDSKDGKNIDFEWDQIAGLTMSLRDSDESKAYFNTPLLDGTANQILFFKVKVTDQDDLSSEKTIKVIIRNVAPVNDPPVAERQDVTANSGEATEITLEATDPQGNALTYALVSNPKSGTITDFNEDTGSLVYTSNDGFTGQDRKWKFRSLPCQLSLCRGHVITVNAVNQPPVAERQDVTANSDEATEITLEARQLNHLKY